MRVTVIVTALLCLAMPSQSASTFFADETAFLTAAGAGLTSESFEGFAATNDFAANSIAVSGLTISTSPESNLGIRANPFLDLHATDGVNFLGWAARPTDPDVVFTFDSPTTRFAVWITDALDGGISGAQLLMSTNGGDNTVVASGALASGTEIFLGLIADTPFTEVTFTVTQMPSGGDGIGFDEVRFPDSPVPVLPATWGLIKSIHR